MRNQLGQILQLKHRLCATRRSAPLQHRIQVQLAFSVRGSAGLSQINIVRLQRSRVADVVRGILCQAEFLVHPSHPATNFTKLMKTLEPCVKEGEAKHLHKPEQRPPPARCSRSRGKTTVPVRRKPASGGSAAPSSPQCGVEASPASPGCAPAPAQCCR